MSGNVLEQLYEGVKGAIADAVVAAGLAAREELPAFVLEVPKDKAHGDLATNAAMQLTKLAKKKSASNSGSYHRQPGRRQGIYYGGRNCRPWLY